MKAELAEWLSSTNCLSERQLSGADLTTYSIGGKIKYFLEPKSEAALKNLIKSLNSQSLRYRIIGAGSNLLISSAEQNIPVIKLGRSFNYINKTDSEGVFKVGAATALMNLSRQLSAQGLSGLEFAGGIPASIGGAVRMNAGAHHGQMADIILAVNIITADGDIEKIAAGDLSFSYRHCSLPDNTLVESVELKLIPGDKDKIQSLREKNLKYRKETQPLTLPSSGSVFKNPSPELAAGRLIEELGMKGQKIAGAEVSTLHANWIVNPEKKASSSDVLELIKLIKTKAAAQRNIELSPELIYWD